jgi:hypothetical protein
LDSAERCQLIADVAEYLSYRMSEGETIGSNVWFDLVWVIFPSIARNMVCYLPSTRMKLINLLKHNPPLYARLREFVQFNPAAYPLLERKRVNGDPGVEKYLESLGIGATA